MREQSVIAKEFAAKLDDVEKLRAQLQHMEREMNSVEMSLCSVENRADELQAELLASIAAAGQQMRKE